MNSPLLSCFVLAFTISFCGAGFAQSAQAQDLEAYRLQLRQQVNSGKITVQEAEQLYIRKQSPAPPQVGADKPLVNPAPGEPVGRGSDNPGLSCQTYPDGRTECR